MRKAVNIICGILAEVCALAVILLGAYLAYDEDKKEKLLEDGTLMKTPIVRNGRQATVGYQPDVWAQWE